MEIGNTAKLIQPTVQGTIIDTEFNKESKRLSHLLEWTDANGQTQTRWFLETELEAVNV